MCLERFSAVHYPVYAATQAQCRQSKNATLGKTESQKSNNKSAQEHWYRYNPFLEANNDICYSTSGQECVTADNRMKTFPLKNEKA